MTKTYTITNDSYWVGNGCDCCEPDYFECYNVEYEDFPMTGSHSRSSEWEIMVDILIENGIVGEDFYDNCDEGEFYYLYSVEKIFDAYGFELEIIG